MQSGSRPGGLATHTVLEFDRDDANVACNAMVRADCPNGVAFERGDSPVWQFEGGRVIGEPEKSLGLGAFERRWVAGEIRSRARRRARPR